MAATVSAWAKPGAWALDSEENEAELIQQQKQSNNHQSNGGAAESDFPSLAAAASTKTKKKKPQTLSLQEFASYGAAAPEKQSTTADKGLTPDELLMLPTGPRQRSAEELDRNRLGGGFRSFDTRSSRGSSDEPRRQGSFNRDSNREFAPSRADEIDNWAATKKSPVGNGYERRERGERGGFFSDSQSRADEVDNWASNKTFVPSEGRRNERRGGGFGSNGGGADSDNWLKKKEEEGPKFGGSFDSLRSRRGSNESMNSADSDTWGRKREEVSNAGGSGSRPRLNLQPRTLPLSEGPQNEVKPKGSSPFGQARPREEVLKDKGQDWKEIDEKLEAVKIKEVTKSTDGPAFGKRGFGSSNGRAKLPEDRTERAWRKPEDVDATPSSPEESEDGHVEETQEAEAEAEEQA